MPYGGGRYSPHCGKGSPYHPPPPSPNLPFDCITLDHVGGKNYHCHCQPHPHPSIYLWSKVQYYLFFLIRFLILFILIRAILLLYFSIYIMWSLVYQFVTLTIIQFNHRQAGRIKDCSKRERQTDRQKGRGAISKTESVKGNNFVLFYGYANLVSEGVGGMGRICPPPPRIKKK